MMDFLEFHADRWEPVTETGCYIWTGSLSGAGYPQCNRRYDLFRLGHRASLVEKLGRPLKDGYETSHICQVRECVNPDHLIEETTSQNMMRKSKEIRVMAAKIAGMSGGVISGISKRTKKALRLMEKSLCL